MRKVFIPILWILLGVYIGSKAAAKTIKVEVVRYVRVPIEVTSGY